MFKHVSQTNPLCSKSHVRCTHITLFVMVCYFFGFALLFYNFLLLSESCFVIVGAADVEGDSGASLSSLPASWK